MPELPEVETIQRGLSPSIQGRKITAFWQSNSPLRIDQAPQRQALAKRLIQQKLQAVGRRGKNMVWLLGDSVLLIHLGMSGRFFWAPKNQAREKHVHWQMAFSGSEQVLRYHDPRRFGGIALFDDYPNLEAQLRLGPEPLPQILAPWILTHISSAPTFDADTLWRATRRSVVPIKVWLMDGRRVAGVGNIYASESLFIAKLSPQRPVRTLTRPAWRRLVEAVRSILSRAVDAGGSTLRDYRQVSGDTGYFQFDFAVYDRAGQACQRCQQPIQKCVQAGRSSFYCARCQR